MTTLDDFGGVLRRPMDTFFWGLTISWSRLLAHVWSGPKIFTNYAPKISLVTGPYVYWVTEKVSKSNLARQQLTL